MLFVRPPDGGGARKNGGIAATGCGPQQTKLAGCNSGSRGSGGRDAAAAHEGQDLGFHLVDGVLAPVDRSQMVEEIGQTAKRDVAFKTAGEAIHGCRADPQFRWKCRCSD